MPQNTAIDHAALLAISLQRKAGEPMHVQLTRALRALILSQKVPSGARLPSSRLLAQELSVSRSTVLTAMDQLIAEGLIHTRKGAGSFASENLPDAPRPARARPVPVPLAEPQPVVPFQHGATDAGLFNHRLWARLLHQAWRDPAAALLANPDPLGWAPLRTAIAGHLSSWRAMTCDPASIVITSGIAEALDLAGRALFAAGDEVLVEDPGYWPMHHALSRASVAVRPVPIDDHGFDITAALKTWPDARGVAVSPSRQFPTGVTMPLDRRIALLDWARQNGGIIIEDDFDSEYRYHGQPLPAIMGQDDGTRVIYMGSFSKVLSNCLRISYLVLPERYLPQVRAVLAKTASQASLVAQPALADFMLSGGFATHIRKCRRIYAARQKALLAAVQQYLGGLLKVAPSPSGMHLIAELSPALAARMDDRTAAGLARRHGVSVSALSTYYASAPARQGLILGYAGFSESQLARAVQNLARALSPPPDHA